ncbi:uncharacterized protein LOC110863507 [Folsomia candida]|uniref:uncharacterized protein LOC110863507 n=1 Tax=Folsomia candida TaxID=158441 RepID=UPI000B907E24|nr:uncharacterized protein LOC110863507 [Folsomia candida]XP_035702420.1 uncharacterized protein LOC110863507 [Folsomia candida]
MMIYLLKWTHDRPGTKRIFFCQTCTNAYSKRKSLLRHELNRCTGLNYKRCERCRIEFATTELYRSHITFESCIKRPPAGGVKVGIITSSKVQVEENCSGIICPVSTCRRWYHADEWRRAHVQKCHATWDNRCVLCEEKFDTYEALFDHLRNTHGSSEEEEEQDLVRVKTELILDDEEIGGEASGVEIGAGVRIKQEVDLDAELDMDKVKREVCDAGGEICNVVNVKIEPGQEF